MLAPEFTFIFFSLILMSFYQGITRNKHKNSFFIGIVLLLILVQGFRYQLGPDFSGYKVAFDLSGDSNLINLGAGLGMELGFLIFNYPFSALGLPLWTFQLVFGGIAIILKLQTLAKNSKFVYIGVLGYFASLYFFEEIIQIRQGFAVGIAFYATQYIGKRDWKRFFLFMLIGFFFHSSILFFAPAYWLLTIKFREVTMFFLLVLSIALTNVGVVGVLEPIVDLLPIDAVQNGFQYRETGYGAALEFSFADVGKVIFVLLIIQYKKQLLKYNPNSLIWVNMLFFATISFFLLRSNAIFAARLTSYYAASFYITLPMLFESLQRSSRRDFIIMYFGFLIYVVLLHFRYINTSNGDFEVYYNFIYNKIDFLNR